MSATSHATLHAELRAQLGRLALDVTLDVGAGGLVLIGPNGAGKTSLLLLLLGALRAQHARVQVGDTWLADTAAGTALPIEARRLGYVPQHYALFPHLDVRGNLELAVQSAAGNRANANANASADTDATRIEAALDDWGLRELARRHPRTLSGGEQQRVALARALSVQPRALLLDEPLAALDITARRQVRRFLAERLRALAIPTIVVTHDPHDARDLGQRIAVLEGGRVTQTGTWSELCGAPATSFVEAFVASE